MRRSLRLFFFALLLAPVSDVLAQHEGLLQIGDPVHRFLLEQQTASHLPGAHLSHLPLSAYEARQYLDELDARREDLTHRERLDLDYYIGRIPHPLAAQITKRIPFLYRESRSFYTFSGEDFTFEVNPLLYLTYGRAAISDRDLGSSSVSVWQNTRGVRAAGHIGRHVFFETRLEEVQRRDARPLFVKRTSPRLPFTRYNAETGVYDYQIATGIAGLRTRHFEVRFGRDRNRWGPGIGSVLLSNFAPAYDQLQIRTTVWRLQYTNLFAALTDLSPFPDDTYGDQILPRKYAAMHRLEINLPARIQLGLFESIIFASDTTDERRRSRFDISYLNPVIFYRAAEYDRGSPDNVLLGFDVAWTALPGLRLYSQFMLDELVAGKIGRKSWVNKWGWLAGAHVVPRVPGLSVRAEYARLRPYLYSHGRPVNAYVHFNDILGHPAGPNAEDFALFVDYRPKQRIETALALAYTRRGRNTDALNYGSDPTLSYDTRVSDDGITLLQGVRQNLLLAEARATYELLPDLFLGGALIVHSIDDEIDGLDRFIAPTILLHWGLPFQSIRY